MSKFSLSRVREKVLPTEIQTDDGQVSIDPCFRTVLRCYRVLSDPDADPRDKLFLLAKWFYKGVPVKNGDALFYRFAAQDEEPESNGDPPVMDFEQDADVIYASFMASYGIDLLESDMHWYKFLALLSPLCGQKTAIGQRISLRELDTSKLPLEDRIKAEHAKARVAITERLSEEEKGLLAELERALENGLDPAPILEKLRGGEVDGKQ